MASRYVAATVQLQLKLHTAVRKLGISFKNETRPTDETARMYMCKSGLDIPQCRMLLVILAEAGLSAACVFLPRRY